MRETVYCLALMFACEGVMAGFLLWFVGGNAGGFDGERVPNTTIAAIPILFGLAFVVRKFNARNYDE